MRIKSVKIKNYHSIVECSFEFPNLLALIGENNSGKSNIIYALNLFFGKEKPRSIYSFNDPNKPIEIIIEFINLTKHEKKEILERHRYEDKFILKKIYEYNLETGGVDYKTTSVKDGKDTNISPRGPQNILADTLPELYLLPAIKYPSEETKIVKTTSFGRFLGLIFQKFEKDFKVWDKIIKELDKEVNRRGKNSPLIQISKELSKVMKEHFSNADINLKAKTINRSDILKSLDIFIDDDLNLPLFTKGQGTQRAFIFAILRILAKKINEERPTRGKEKKDIIIAIEEPELYLHPHQQKIVYRLLKELSKQTKEQIQIIYSTHSSFMVHLEEYQYIGIVKKKDISMGTKVIQYTQDIFTPNSKKEFQLMCQFDPERNEMFFAKKIVFVEGDTEKFSIPIILNKIGIDPIKESISIVECGSKGGIELFAQVLNKFNESGGRKIINYLVIHDKDIPWKDQGDPNRVKKERQAQKQNQDLKTLCATNPIYVCTPDFERELGLTLSDKSKPYKACNQINGMKAQQLSKKLIRFLKKNLA